jgi:hypothetical protein
MADSAKWATAAEPIEEKGTFMRAYQDNRQSAIEASLEGSPVATVLREMVKEVLHWEGTASELLNLLWQRADERTKMQRSWPKSAKGLSSQLRRLATALRATGIEIKHSELAKVERALSISKQSARIRQNRQLRQLASKSKHLRLTNGWRKWTWLTHH